MKRELEDLALGIEAVSDRLFNHRLHLAHAEFVEINDQLQNLDIYNLPEKLIINLHDVRLEPLRVVPGNQIFMFMNDSEHQIICYRPKNLFPDGSYYVLLLPELNENDKVDGLSVGLAKHDGKQFFTGWADSRFDLTARRQREKSNHVWMVQYCYTPDLYQQLEANKELGFAYLFSSAQAFRMPQFLPQPILSPT